MWASTLFTSPYKALCQIFFQRNIHIKRKQLQYELSRTIHWPNNQLLHPSLLYSLSLPLTAFVPTALWRAAKKNGSTQGRVA